MDSNDKRIIRLIRVSDELGILAQNQEFVSEYAGLSIGNTKRALQQCEELAQERNLTKEFEFCLDELDHSSYKVGKGLFIEGAVYAKTVIFYFMTLLFRNE
ncbi:hypothetical protein EFA69_19045 [Rufibacter immobilis]|uniref:Uncharacterized protein n=1 Tax=Rufibacter immobilis TaxID=1348778 RepID=A0A3M9MRN5_9BACT|nr:hypothetical protein [Rufibacter immobilis]RNI28170.1 hypothetical protein EFA69_19045 [Rufibacter immobilis]